MILHELLFFGGFTWEIDHHPHGVEFRSLERYLNRAFVFKSVTGKILQFGGTRG